jgi:drug/metabolite transporter (DMT)-like permease
MIQRIQSLLLALVAIFYILLFFVPVFVWAGYTNSNGQVMDTKNMTALYNLPFTILNVCIILLSIFTITQFKNRKKQRTYAFILCFIIILNICLYMYYVMLITIGQEYILQPARSFGMYLQLISIILCLVAARRIKKDDDLVKSIDRIR